MPRAVVGGPSPGSLPRSEILRNLAAHEWYHTGQLIVYQSMRGLNPDD